MNNIRQAYNNAAFHVARPLYTPEPMGLPLNAEGRCELNDELHVHPYEPLQPPTRVLTLVMLRGGDARAEEIVHLKALCAHFGRRIEVESLSPRLQFDDFLLKIESHQDFTRYKFIAPAEAEDITRPCAGNAMTSRPLSLLPDGWLKSLPGRLLVALDLTILPFPEGKSHAALMQQYAGCFDADTVCASQIGRSKSLAMTDFRIGDNGFSRILLLSRAGLSAQIGRLAYRLIDIETYRMLAMQILEPARMLGKRLPAADARLIELAAAISGGGGESDEQLMERLTALAAEVEAMVSAHYRPFTLARNRFDLVLQRLDELYEQPIGPQSTLGGFLRRRLIKARTTSDATFQWLEQLADRIAQASQSLRTRIDVHNETQNREMLAAMNRRFQVQLRLQQAAEMMTVAIFTYYGVNVLDFVYQALAPRLLMHADSVVFKAIAAPMLAAAAVWFIYRLRRKRSE